MSLGSRIREFWQDYKRYLDGLGLVVALAFAALFLAMCSNQARGAADYEVSRYQCRRFADSFHKLAEARDKGKKLRDVVMDLLLSARERGLPAESVSLQIDIAMHVYLTSPNDTPLDLQMRSFSWCMKKHGFRDV